MTKKNITIGLLAFLLLAPGFLQAQAGGQGKKKGVLLKNLVRIEGIRSNQLLGYGLVVGLPGTGDTRSKLAGESIRNLLGVLGQKLSGADKNVRNIAAVLVTAEIPPFAKKGDRLNVRVSSIGDARSLEGGVLIRTALQGGNRKIYAAAQGVVTMGGGSVGRRGNSPGKTVGLVLNGAIIERDLKFQLGANRKIRISLKQFDFETLNKVQEGIKNTFKGIKQEIRSAALDIEIPVGLEPIAFLAQLENIRIIPATPARVVINERSGTIVMGGDIRVDPVSVSRGPMQLTVTGQKTATGIAPELDIRYGGKGEGKKGNKKKGISFEFKGASVKEIIKALNKMGASVKDIIAILEALRDSGALHAKLIVI